MLGALVLLLSSMASALEFTNRRFLAVETIKTLTNSEAYDLLRALSRGTNVPDRTIPIPSINKTVVITDSIRAVMPAAFPKYTTPTYLEFMRWRNAHTTTFSGFQYNGGSDGICWQRKNTNIGVSETGSWQAVTFSSGQPDYYKAYVHITSSSGPYTWYSGESAYPNHGDKITSFLGECFNANTFTFYDYFTANDVYTDLPIFVTPSASEVGGAAVRASLQAYYQEEQTPSYAPFQFVGYSDAELDSACSFASCPTTGTPGTGGGTPGTGGTSTPPCTKDDGNISGNPYDCAPVDNENNCSIIDLPCNLKWLFIPREDFFTSQLPEIFTKSFDMPLQVTDRIEFNIPFLGKDIPMGLNFGQWTMNNTFQGIIKLVCGFSCLYWLLNFFGIPNVFGNTAGSSALHDSYTKAGQITENGRLDRLSRSGRALPGVKTINGRGRRK